ncbi:unnamed protein product [Leptidea sinapis]|uniref:Cas1p 10 TM acyl transferase domain-containing protein n=1 Tax=Leptidea sinapis TaxID=189913 RepID=A0A5E4QNV6_9NEOP|nr:unnamed protein product [Leptidea sinapis]
MNVNPRRTLADDTVEITMNGGYWRLSNANVPDESSVNQKQNRSTGLKMGSHPKKNTAEWFIDHLNVQNAKLLAFFLVLGFIGYHGILHLRFGPDSCTWLLSSGRYKGDHEWQPYGCMLHKYSKTDARRCLRYLAFWGKYNSFAFIGDSRLEQLYEHFISALKTRLDGTSFSTIEHHMPNYTYVDSKLRLSVTFIWSDDVSRTMLVRNRNVTEQYVDEYKRNLTRLVQPIDSLAQQGTQVLWKVLESVDVSKPNAKISNNDIDVYNRAAVEILQHSAAKIWSAPRLIAAGAPSADADGVSLSLTALRHTSQILLNMYCNDHMNFNDGSAVLAVMRAVWRWSQKFKHQLNGYSLVKQPPTTTSPITALAKLGMIMLYFYLCDRTNFFMKENKYYSEWSFWLPVGYVVALGLFFTDESRSSSHSRVLHREQTNEWKGWMQLVILVYQVTGASKVLPIYMLVRALQSSYLFLTGYGHLYYTWKTGDVGLVRYFRVIFRLNFFTIVLCLTMNRPYQFYSFIPLVSFWYTLMFALFALPPYIAPLSSHTQESKPYQYLIMALKVMGLLIIVTVLYMTYGIIFGVAYLLAQRYSLLDDNNHSNLFSRGGSLCATLLAFIGIGSYVTFTFLCTNAFDCNEIHSYVSFLPVYGYILLRNISGALRTRHSSLFAWFGNITLELFASQSHTWLAADTHGVLVLVPAAPVLNLIVTSYIFVFAAHEVHQLTAAILPYAVPDDWRLVLRNFAIFLAILVPIGIHDGMF